MNIISSYIDGSQIYGKDYQRSVQLRTLSKGEKYI